MVGGHEDDEQELRVVAVGQPVHDRDLLLAGAADEVEVEAPRGVERERVVEQQARRSGSCSSCTSSRGLVIPSSRAAGVDAGEREAVHLGRRPGEGDVDHADAAAGGESRVQSAGARL